MYTPPANIWEVNRTLQFDEPLNGDQDPRWVDTEQARGKYGRRQLHRTLGVSAQGGLLGTPPQKGYYLFCGHRGCGKSTELRRIRNQLHTTDRYYVIFGDAARELDVNNLRYPDILMHLAGKLATQLEDDAIRVDSIHLARLRDWFTTRIESREETREFAQQVHSGIRGEPTIPLIARIFAEISSALKTNSTYKDELRRTLRNYFSDFADAFNQFIDASNDAIRDARRGRQILFVVDGTDRLSDEDARAFFVTDVHQLQQVHSMFIYCAPIHLMYEGAGITHSFNLVVQLPMIKIEDANGTRDDAGYSTMHNMLYLRAAPDLFAKGVPELLIQYSGGHPRDLLRLLQITFSFSEGDRFELSSAQHAVRQLASEFRRILDPEDYQLLANIDSNPSSNPHSDRARRLLYNLAVLEYNDYYWRSHPVIRTTDDYVRAKSRTLLSAPRT